MPETPRTDILKLFSLIQRKTRMHINEQVGALGLTGAQVPFLLVSCERGGVPQNQLCALLDMDKSTVAKMLARLEAQGYVTRRASGGDARSFDILPTPRAYEVFPRLCRIGDDWMLEITSGMTDIERAIFIQLLERAADNASRSFLSRAARDGTI